MLRQVTKLLTRPMGLLTQIRYGIREGDFPYTTNTAWQSRKLKRLVEIKPIRHETWNDELKFVGPPSQLQSVALYVQKHEASSYSLSTIATLIYNLSKNNVMTLRLFEKLEPHVPKFLGEFTGRIAYGMLYGALKYDRKELENFTFNEVKLKSLVFTADEAIEVIEALEAHTLRSYEQKQQFWYEHFFPLTQQFMAEYQDNNPRRVLRILKALTKLEIYDEVIWHRLAQLLHGKRGWVRVQIYEFLYPHLQRFPFLQELLDTLHEQIANNVDMRWRYNLAERRLFSNQEMMDKSQDHIELIPQMSTFFKQHEIPELTTRFEELKEKGTLEEEAQLEEDRARALSYVLYDKFKREAADRNLFDPAEFERLYGMTEQEIHDMLSQKERTKTSREMAEGDEEQGELEDVDEEGHESVETGAEGDKQEQVEQAPVDHDAGEDEDESEEEDSQEDD